MGFLARMVVDILSGYEQFFARMKILCERKSEEGEQVQ
jgi:hypothetical protein